MQTISVPLSPIVRIVTLLDTPALRRLIQTILTPYLWLFRGLRLLNINTDSTKAFTERSEVIWNEAKARGIEMQQFVILNKPIEQYRAKINNKWEYFESIPVPAWLPQRSYTWMDDKWLLKKKLQAKNIPVPQGAHVATFAQAKKVFDQIRHPVIIKPELGSRGRHTTTFIYTLDELKAAYKIAKQLGFYVVVEEMLMGSVYRGTYVGGEVVGILRGDPPRITGDGLASIAQLIEKKNKEKDSRVKDVVVTSKTKEFLARLGYTLESILEKDKTIDLTEKIGTSYGGFAAEEIQITHPKTLTYLKQAGDILNAPVVGFDFIIPDITADPDTQFWGIIEANSLPFINLHHFPLEGTPINVAAKVWDLWKK
jgi:D-alanine-D-alanine ligase-like ATP-grasp enzyme